MTTTAIEKRQQQGDYAALWRVAESIDGNLFGLKSVQEAFTLMLIGDAEGIHPIHALQKYHIIKGKPVKKADAMLADFFAAGGRVEWHEQTDASVSATFSHPQGGTIRVTWDAERVRKAGLTGNHSTYPAQMKRARCISEGVRATWPAAAGIGIYTPEEMQDVADGDRQQAEARVWQDVAASHDPAGPDAASEGEEMADAGQLEILRAFHMQNPAVAVGSKAGNARQLIGRALKRHQAAKVSDLTEQQAAALIGDIRNGVEAANAKAAEQGTDQPGEQGEPKADAPAVPHAAHFENFIEQLRAFAPEREPTAAAAWTRWVGRAGNVTRGKVNADRFASLMAAIEAGAFSGDASELQPAEPEPAAA